MIDASPARSQLLDRVSVARWAAQAASLLRQYNVTEPLAGGSTAELRQLLSWSATFEDYLAARGWCTHDDTLAMLTSLHAAGELSRQRRRLVFLDIRDITPAGLACIKLLEEAGWVIEQRSLPDVRAQVVTHGAASQYAELQYALDWLYERLAEDPQQKVALVKSQSFTESGALRRRTGVRSDTGLAGGSSPLDSAPVAAALNALEMLGPDGNADQLSAWLRSPFMQGTDPADLGDTARFEIAERELVVAQLPLRRQRAALLNRMAAFSQAASDRLAAAMAGQGRAPSVAPITTWVRIWQDQLHALGWMRGWASEAFTGAARMLEQGLNSLTGLNSMLGAIDGRRALFELRAALCEPLVGSRLPVTGLHVLDSPDDVGPGYAAVWVMGMSDADWPLRTRPNPLLPARLQSRFAMPWSGAEYRRVHAEQTVKRLRRSVPKLVLSWSQNDDGESVGPAAVVKPLLTERPGFKPATESPKQGSPDAEAGADYAIVEDAVQRLSPQRRLRGGAGLLNRQADCPLRAFIDYRLHATELPRRTRGISRALRGQILHEAAAALLQPGTQSADLREAGASDRIARIAEQTVDEYLAGAKGWFSQLALFEGVRLRKALTQLIETDIERGEFTVRKVEANVALQIDQLELRARIDRLDQLTSGQLAIIDYKTGTSGARPQWFNDERADFQMPLYAVAYDGDIAAIALCSVAPDKTEYRGFWLDRDSFRTKSIARLNQQEWTAQLMSWKSEIYELVRNFVSGDTSFYELNDESLLGMYAPLSRLREPGVVAE